MGADRVHPEAGRDGEIAGGRDAIGAGGHNVRCGNSEPANSDD